MQKGLVEWIQASRRKVGPRVAALPILSEVDGDASCLITLRTILNIISHQPRLQTVAIEIGRAIEREARFQAFEMTNPHLYRRIDKHINESPMRGEPGYRQRVLTYSANKYAIAWNPWHEELHLSVGMVMIDLCIKHTGWVKTELIGSGKARTKRSVLTPTDELVSWLNEHHSKCELLSPLRLPMTVPPLDHTKTKDGGYITPALRYPVVKVAKLGPQIDYCRAKMPRAFDALNYLQSVPYEVDDEVREVAERMWEMGHDLPGAARRLDLPLPHKPIPAVKENPAYLEYKIRAREVFLENRSSRGQRLSVANTLAVARRMSGKTIWFPLKFDFRSRIYCQPNYLTPQGSDLAKGMLRFHRAVKLGEEGLRWLKIHTANCWGIDKVSFDERVAWVDAHLERLVRASKDPLSDRWWTEAENPFQFLASILELSRAVTSEVPELYESRLPVTVDGSCNGIQHLAALSRDEDAGAQVNLVPAEKPSDIYGRVAEETIRRLKEIKCSPASSLIASSGRPQSREASAEVAYSGPSDSDFATLWLIFGVTRGATKRPTMIMPYNGTMAAVEKYIQLWLREQIRDGAKVCPFGRNRDRACRFLSRVMWEAINAVAPGPRRMMQWIRSVAAVASKHGMAVTITTPADFTVKQAYAACTGKRVKTRLGDRSVRLTLAKETDRLDTRRQAQSLAPNWIHSLDAAALQLTVLRLWSLGIKDMVAVHDSYGTHAGNVGVLAWALRDVFVEMYEGDVLGAFIADVQKMLPAGVELPKPPAMGCLEIGKVREAGYFFA